MSKNLDPSPIYYVYFLCDPDSGIPFYVGKGKNDRYKNHFLEAKKYREGKLKGDFNIYKLGKINNIELSGKTVLVEIPLKDLCEDDALMWENYFIAHFGRYDLGFGSLTNLTDGGEGEGMSLETKEKLRNINLGKKYSEETNKMKGYSGKLNPFYNKTHSEDTIKFLSDLNSGFVMAFDIIDQNLVRITQEQFEEHKNIRYVGVTSKLAPNTKRATKGKGMFHDPITLIMGYYVPGKEPEGWIRGKAPNTKTTNGRNKYHNPDTLEVRYFYDCPEGWVKGEPIGIRKNGRNIFYDPITKETRFLYPEDAPEHWLKGRPPKNK